MILLWFSPLGEKLPIILLNGSQNRFLGVQMNVSMKKFLWKDFKNFINSGLRAKTFRTFGIIFPQSYQNSLLLDQSEVLRKKLSEGCCNFVSFADIEHFFGFWLEIFSFCQKCGLGVQKNVSKNFCLQKIFSFITFGLWKGIFLTSGLVFFGAITKSAFYVYGGKILWIFPELIVFFFNFETLIGELSVLRKLGSRVVKTAFLRVQKSTVKTNFFGRSFNFSSLSDIGQYLFTFAKKTFGMVVNSAVYLYRRTFWECVSFQIFSINFGPWVKKGLTFGRKFSASLSKLHSNLPDKQFEKEFVSKNVWFVLSL